MSVLRAVTAFFIWLGLVQAKLVRETLEFTWGVGSPDGVPRQMILTNGKYPGPDLVFDEDDDVEVFLNRANLHTVVIDKLDLDTCHQSHAVQYDSPLARSIVRYCRYSLSETRLIRILCRMESAPWSDGVPGLSQAPIQPNSSFVYKFKASPAGTFWFVVLRCLVPSLHNVQGSWPNQKPDAVPSSMHNNCTPSDGGVPIIEVDAKDGWASLNFIGAQAQKGTTFSVDNHPMWIYEVDGQFVEPRQYEMVGMYNGARYSALVKLNQTPGDYAIRITDNGGDQVISGYAILSYRAANTTENGTRPQAQIGPTTKGYIDYAGQNTSASVRHLNYTTNLPAFNVPLPPAFADLTLKTNMTRVNSSYQWSIGNGVLYEPEVTADTPLMFEKQPLDVIPSNFTLQTLNNTWVDIIIQIISDPEMDPIHPPHPIHKHGNRAYIIGDGMGVFNWSTVYEGMLERPDLFYLNKPALRDTFVTNTLTAALDGGVWIAIRYHVSGPFPSLLHCHITTHQEGGMALALLDGIDVWSELPTAAEVVRLQNADGPVG
ncbi:unnamed protein product [Aspergillus oryzae var. brunneus]|uniref:Unnamed protein product n=2 Tax=Aspergillus oryzae TaxID=5062 RepID=A0AAN4YZY5_ASPOZ|nr:unnamed protein product [Aspergillus oryzae]GMG37251.1 unnamed protein product [Aspergillus oryzae]GMG46757.1 unnamed protein product [Aspergillus oryzae var. brunneus]